MANYDRIKNMSDQTKSVIETLIGIFAVSLAMRYLASRSKRAQEINSTGKAILKFSNLLGVIGWAALATSLFVTTMVIIQPRPLSQGALLVLAGLCGSFIVLSAYLILMCRNFLIEFDDEKIVCQDIFRKQKAMLWKDIQKIEFSALSQYLILKDGNKKIQKTKTQSFALERCIGESL